MVYARLLLGGSAFLFALVTLSWALLSCNKLQHPRAHLAHLYFTSESPRRTFVTSVTSNINHCPPNVTLAQPFVRAQVAAQAKAPSIQQIFQCLTSGEKISTMGLCPRQ